MDSTPKPMRLPQQHSRYGKTGYVGEEDGRVETFEKQPRFPDNGTKPALAEKLADMSDEQLAALGVSRAEPPEPPRELHDFEPNRGGVNCKTCRKPEGKGDHNPQPESTAETPNEQVVGEHKEPAKPKKASTAKRHRPKAGAAKGK